MWRKVKAEFGKPLGPSHQKKNILNIQRWSVRNKFIQSQIRKFELFANLSNSQISRPSANVAICWFGIADHGGLVLNICDLLWLCNLQTHFLFADFKLLQVCKYILFLLTNIGLKCFNSNFYEIHCNTRYYFWDCLSKTKLFWDCFETESVVLFAVSKMGIMKFRYWRDSGLGWNT